MDFQDGAGCWRGGGAAPLCAQMSKQSHLHLLPVRHAVSRLSTRFDLNTGLFLCEVAVILWRQPWRIRFVRCCHRASAKSCFILKRLFSSSFGVRGPVINQCEFKTQCWGYRYWCSSSSYWLEKQSHLKLCLDDFTSLLCWNKSWVHLNSAFKSAGKAPE